MRDVNPKEMIEYFRTFTGDYPDYTPREIANVLLKLGEENDADTFKELVDTWNDYVVRLWEGEWPEAKAKNGALENIASMAVVADLGLRMPVEKDELPVRIYQDESKYGSTMEAFSQYLGIRGLELVIYIWPNSYQRFLDQESDPSLN